jgi:hypothetical protein
MVPDDVVSMNLINRDNIFFSLNPAKVNDLFIKTSRKVSQAFSILSPKVWITLVQLCIRPADKRLPR